MSDINSMSNDVQQYREQTLAISRQLHTLVDDIEKLDVPDDIPLKRDQLREITKTITNLENVHIPVPDELRQRKTELLASVHRAEEVEQLCTLVEEELLQLLAHARHGVSEPPDQVMPPPGRACHIPLHPPLQAKSKSRGKNGHQDTAPDLFGWKPSVGGLTPPNSPASPGA